MHGQAERKGIMTLTGIVQNGVVVLENGCPLPEGTQVAVVIEPQKAKAASPLGEALLCHAGKAVDLPHDLAAQHNHYLHGTPKRQ
jgi:hypothetical protein